MQLERFMLLIRLANFTPNKLSDLLLSFEPEALHLLCRLVVQVRLFPIAAGFYEHDCCRSTQHRDQGRSARICPARTGG
jgi:hypothetical protein